MVISIMYNIFNIFLIIKSKMRPILHEFQERFDYLMKYLNSSLNFRTNIKKWRMRLSF